MEDGASNYYFDYSTNADIFDGHNDDISNNLFHTLLHLLRKRTYSLIITVNRGYVFKFSSPQFSRAWDLYLDIKKAVLDKSCLLTNINRHGNIMLVLILKTLKVVLSLLIDKHSWCHVDYVRNNVTSVPLVSLEALL